MASPVATSPRRFATVGGICVTLAGVSLLLPAAPAYDPWAWLIWGREATRLELSTAGGPAFKPLPVALTALLAPAGDAAPVAWLVVARTGALAGLVAGFAVARRLAPAGVPGTLAGAVAAAGIALTDGYLAHAAVGNAEPLFIALVLGAASAALAGHHGRALGLGGAAALIRPESWPFLLAYGAWRGRRVPALRPALTAAAVAIPAAWLVPEWLASGDPLRSGARALVPNDGAPALAEHPAQVALAAAAGLLFVPTALAVVAARPRAALLPAAAGAAWIACVAVMAPAGFSGEARYALPGAALLAVSGGVGVARLARSAASVRGRRLPLALALAAGTAPFAVARVERLADPAPRLAHEAALAAALPAAIEAAGGSEHLLACGRPAVARFRGPLLAYHLGVEKRRVRADGGPGPVTFGSRPRAGAPFEPPVHGKRGAEATGERWRIETACAPRRAAVAGRHER